MLGNRFVLCRWESVSITNTVASWRASSLFSYLHLACNREEICWSSMDSSSRRAFALDSRSVWVEQQLVHDVLLARDNLPLGPGEYTASSNALSKHISTPSLGRPRSPGQRVTFESPTKLRIRTTSPTNAQMAAYSSSSSGIITDKERSLRRVQSPTQTYLRRQEASAVSPQERSEFMTIFHDQDQRDPIDTRRRYCPTPGPYLAHDSILETVKNDGKRCVRGTIPFGPNNVPFGRGTWKTALPEYDVNYDSKYIRPALQQGSFPKSKRIYIPLGTGTKINEDRDGRISDGKMEAVSPLAQADRPQSPTIAIRSLSPSQLGAKSIMDVRCSLVTLPKLKKKSITQPLLFDASCYKKPPVGALDISPSIVKHAVRNDAFQHILAIPRPHKAPGVQIPGGLPSPGHATNSSHRLR